jgi:hypothetical protein
MHLLQANKDDILNIPLPLHILAANSRTNTKTILVKFGRKGGKKEA